MQIIKILKAVAGQLFSPRHLPRNLMITLLVAGILAGVVAVLYNQGLLQQGLNHLGASVSTSPNLIATLGIGGGGAASVGVGLLGSAGLAIKHIVDKMRQHHEKIVVEGQPFSDDDEEDWERTMVTDITNDGYDSNSD